MGYFKDAFDISSGATLGNLTVNVGAQLGANLVEAKSRQAFINYRSQYFDPVIRQDLNELLVFDRLPQLEYPFPGGKKSGGVGNFFRRHKVFTTALVVYVILMPAVSDFVSSLGDVGDVDSIVFVAQYVSLAIWSLFFASIAVVIGKIFRKGANALSGNYKSQLESWGRHYWHVREYVRQALTSGEMDKKTAITKISNTELARQFPDTVDEIEANAFYYRQEKLGDR